MNHKRFIKKTNLILKIVLAVIAIVLIVLVIRMLTAKKIDTTSISIILAAHKGESELALGGMLSQDVRQEFIANFFTGASTTADSLPHTEKGGIKVQNFGYDSLKINSAQSPEELQTELSRDIQSLIIANTDKTVYIYGPSIFATTTNDIDAEVLYNAYVDVASSFPNTNVHFYFYENYPQAEQFNKQSVISVKKNIENNSGLILDTVNIPLTALEVNKKIQLVKRYTPDIVEGSKAFTEKRCAGSACEVVYEVRQYQ